MERPRRKSRPNGFADHREVFAESHWLSLPHFTIKYRACEPSTACSRKRRVSRIAESLRGPLRDSVRATLARVSKIRPRLGQQTVSENPRIFHKSRNSSTSFPDALLP